MPRLLCKSYYRDYTRLGKQNYRKEYSNMCYKEVGQQYYKFYREIDKSHRQKSIGRPQGRLANQNLGKVNQLNKLLSSSRVDRLYLGNQLNKLLSSSRVDRLYLEQIKYIQRGIPYYLRLLIYIVIFVFRFLDLTLLSIEIEQFIIFSTKPYL